MRKFMIVLLVLALCSCKRKWTDKDKNDFYAGCMSSAVNNTDIKDPKAYCKCLLEKVVAKYSDAGDAAYIKYDTTVRQLARECLAQQ